MNEPANAAPREMPVQAGDLRGLARLGIDGVVGLADLVEAMHHTIGRRAVLRAPTAAGRTSGLTGIVYRTVRGSTRAIGLGLDALLGVAGSRAGPAASTPAREAFIAALNGVWGDHLARTRNPLAIPMSLRAAGRALDLAGDAPVGGRVEPAGRVLVLVHGLCMSDLQWLRDGHDHGQALARELGWTPLYLHYNSGRHVSENGRAFADLLERLVARWPVPVAELAIVGHSMGGLVTRSACHYGDEAGHRWRASLRRIACLGTPHHGAALERGGHLVDTLFGISAYAAPLARLGKARSAGITDLRFGNLQDADWQGRDRHAQRRDDRRPTGLPAGVDTLLVAATTRPRRGRLHDALVGDGVVPLASALGEHRNASHALHVPATRRAVVTSCSHWDLLNHAEVYARLRDWLADAPRIPRVDVG